MKSFACETCSKDPKCRTETPCLTTETWWLVLNDFFHHMAYRLTFPFDNWTPARCTQNSWLPTSNINSNVKRLRFQIIVHQ